MEDIKYYFVVNPVSGKNDEIDVVNELIIPACEKTGINYEIYYTKCKGDGTRFVHETSEQAGDKIVRFYAVGGDGTLYEVVNGAFGHKNAQIGVVPKGSGNDWIRLFGTREQFLDVENNIKGTPAVVDCLKVNDVIALNQASMGFDAETTAAQAKMKKLPGAAGHLTYLLAGLYCAITQVKFDFTVKVDGKEYKGPFIQVVGCNSRWYGSGIKVAPFALPDDGKIDVVIFRRISSWPVLFKVMMYNWQVKGDHYKRSYVEYVRATTLDIESKKAVNTNIDGEYHKVNNFHMEVCPKSISFVVPAGSSYFDDRASGTINGDINLGWRHKEPFHTIFSKTKLYDHLFNRKYH